jgi:signal transduction histidine kinase
MPQSDKKLQLTFHGRIIDHLGIQMYQSPVAAVAELVSNAWDADAEHVDITLPDGTGEDKELIVSDDGIGMTFQECQERFLKVGQNRRGNNSTEETAGKKRKVLGRKGIGKFAGFGIAEIIRVETVSGNTGEKTVFELDINKLRSDQYVEKGGNVTVIDYAAPNQNQKDNHGTKVCLKSLSLKRSISPGSFAQSMARRFLLCNLTDDFSIKIDRSPLPDDVYSADVEYVFPRDWDKDEMPRDIYFDQDNGWAVEKIQDKTIHWKFVFFKETISNEELRGISIFSNGKLAQKPFFFNIAGGISGQHALEYMSGQVQADFVDSLNDDIIATERQRINWEHEEVQSLEEWGQKRVKLLAGIWKAKRGEKRRQEIEDKVSSFSQRLEKLPKHEQKTLRQALNKLGSIETLSDKQFQEMGESILQAWDQGRLKNLIDDLSHCEDITAEQLLQILVEADVLVALNVAESIRTKLEAIRGLKKMKKNKELETKIRDYIAERPYLLDPKWETFKVEKSLKHILKNAADKAKLNQEDSAVERKRVDLALLSNEHLLVVEFMRPGKPADYDHLTRCQRYVINIRTKIKSESDIHIKHVTGLIIADRIDEDPEIIQMVEALEQSDIWACSWSMLLSRAEARWQEYLDVIVERAPNDTRVQSLKSS